ncbi:hypothetical protein [Bradyrhizobium sp. CCGUVB23]|uniref:hypothetical protein n=1 Tax=Bradyrhizobium sp. CCGUVB23 TaxID=2949630 RepID=UPI0020B22BFA|nr:hypothetical protein [Bradyrhizobium sp. CCGUVB23]MCP3464688.1 hypothetical protein [Bradyrhizobium sp. CCGUVB23]
MLETGALKSVERRIVDRRVLHLLLANLYMRRFVLGSKMLGLERSLGSRIVAYADDLVILCRRARLKNPAPPVGSPSGKRASRASVGCTALAAS